MYVGMRRLNIAHFFWSLSYELITTSLAEAFSFSDRISQTTEDLTFLATNDFEVKSYGTI